MEILDGMGILCDGFDKPCMMTVMPYNPPYYPKRIEALGFRKRVDYVSCYAEVDSFRIPERVRKIAERVERHGTLRVQHLRNRAELRALGMRAAKAYNSAFVNNWEYAPQTNRELTLLVDSLVWIADPKLVKLIVHGEDVVGFVLALPDAAAALRRCHGKLLPFGGLDLFWEMRRTRWIALNAIGVLPEFQGMGANALLYSTVEKIVRRSHFAHAAVYQVAESAQMTQDLGKLGLEAGKSHRIYIRDI